MLPFKCVIILTVIIGTSLQFALSDICGNKNQLIGDLSSCTRYKKCTGGIWKTLECPYNTTFDGTHCSTSIPCEIREEAEEETSAIDNVQSGNGTISSCKLVGATVKCFKSLSRRDKKGQNVTTLWYYNSAGLNYKFSIVGKLPAPPFSMIPWLELNGHKYKRTPITYDEKLSTGLTAPSNTGHSPPVGHEPHRNEPPRLVGTHPSLVGSNLSQQSSADDVLPKECGVSLGNDDKISFGKRNAIEEMPWQAVIVRKMNITEAMCGGSIISSRHVISAVHCFQDFPGLAHKISISDVLVRVGREDLNERGSQYNIRRLLLHDKYNKAHKRNDIALIMIEGEFKFSNKVFPICLPHGQEELSPGRECQISGFGTTNGFQRRPTSDSTLLSAKIKIAALEECIERYGRIGVTIGSGMICAGNFDKRGADTCQGDSGGPLACQNNQGKFVLFGVTSFGVARCEAAPFPGVYTRVSKYIGWIRNRIDISVGIRKETPLLTIENARVKLIGTCGNTSLLISDPTSCTRYKKCMDGFWKIVECPYNTTFDGTNCSRIPCEIKRGVEEEEEEEETATSSIDNAPLGRNVTKIRYFNSAGRSYEFSIFGKLPAPRFLMIPWLELNSHHYKLTPVPYDPTPSAETTALNGTRHSPSGKLESANRNEPPALTGWLPALVSNFSSLLSADDVLPKECGLSFGDDDKVSSGTKRVIEEMPWQAVIVDKKNIRQAICGGSIISARYVLSAVQCLTPHSKKLSKDDIFILVGLEDLYKEEGSHYNVRGWFLHDKYNRSHRRNDIALIMIEGEFKISSRVFPICLPRYQEGLNPGRECHISGFSATILGRPVDKASSRLLSAKIKVAAIEECSNSYGKIGVTIGGGMICAGNFDKGGVDTCQGDAGGPLYCQNDRGMFILFGVTSFGRECGAAHFPGVYTRVPEYIGWIRNRIEVSMGIRRPKPLLTTKDGRKNTNDNKAVDNKDEEDVL